MIGPLIGERVVLRPFRETDADDLYAYASDPEVVAFMLWRAHRDRGESLAHIQNCQEGYTRGWYPLAVADKASDRLVGSFDLRVISAGHRTGEIGYVLSRATWGTGINVEAGALILELGFDRIGLNRIQASCDIENRRSYRTLEKMGLTREGILRQYRVRGGQSHDHYMYSMLKREWARPERAQTETPLAMGLEMDRCSRD